MLLLQWKLNAICEELGFWKGAVQDAWERGPYDLDTQNEFWVILRTMILEIGAMVSAPS